MAIKRWLPNFRFPAANANSRPEADSKQCVFAPHKAHIYRLSEDSTEEVLQLVHCPAGLKNHPSPVPSIALWPLVKLCTAFRANRAGPRRLMAGCVPKPARSAGRDAVRREDSPSDT